MLRKNFEDGVHVSGRDLLLWADGELSSQRAAEIQRHLSGCWKCRARMAELEHTIADFVQLYGQEPDAELPAIEGPRALLKARLAERRASQGAGSNLWHERVLKGLAAGVAATLLLLAGAAIGISHHGAGSRIGAIPNLSLTPGATNPMGIGDVCRADVSPNDPAVPDPLKREVLKEYGLKDLPADAYEIDYLVTPRLGGAADIRNLWPEPSLHTVWNARVKDALEDRLHYLVCSGQLDLATAQREISQDWVAAYKKYFGTNEPLQEHSGGTG